MKKILITIFVLIITFGIFSSSYVQSNILNMLIKSGIENNQIFPEEDALSVLVCGSGSPLGTAVAQTCLLVKAGDKKFIVDIGNGSVNNLMTWSSDLLEDINGVLITHLHSDHIADLGDLNLVTWVTRDRKQQLEVFGPEGINDVVSGYNLAFSRDSNFRYLHHGNQIADPLTGGMTAKEIEDGSVIFEDDNLKISAFKVFHEPIEPALGYKFEYKDRVLVISGDTRYDSELIKSFKGADVLFCEVISPDIVDRFIKVAEQQNDAKLKKILVDILDYHISPLDAVDLANEAGVRHLVYYHLTPTLPTEIRFLSDKFFFAGVDEAIENWTASTDGTMVVLPSNSKEILISEIN